MSVKCRFFVVVCTVRVFILLCDSEKIFNGQQMGDLRFRIMEVRMTIRSLMSHNYEKLGWKEKRAKVRALSLELNQLMNLNVTQSIVSDKKEPKGCGWIFNFDEEHDLPDFPLGIETGFSSKFFQYVGPEPLSLIRRRESSYSVFLRTATPRTLVIFLLKLTFDSKNNNDAHWTWGGFDDDVKLAILMALHPRLGRESPISLLATDIVRLIISLGAHVLH